MEKNGISEQVKREVDSLRMSRSMFLEESRNARNGIGRSLLFGMSLLDVQSMDKLIDVAEDVIEGALIWRRCDLLAGKCLMRIRDLTGEV